MQRPYIHPYAYSILILVFTVITSAAAIKLLLLINHCEQVYFQVQLN